MESEWQQGVAGSRLPVPDSAHGMEEMWNACEASRVWGPKDRNQLGDSGHQERLRQ